MATLLVGRAAIYDATSNVSTGEGFENAYRFTALTSGTVDELRFRVGDGNSGGAVLKLGIYSDASGTPGALLGSGTTGTVIDNSWMSATGLSVPVTMGTAYHLAVLPVGYDVYYNENPVYTSDNPQKFASGGPYTSLQDPWPGTDSGWDEAGAIGFQALTSGDVAGFTPTGLEFHVTGIIANGETTAAYYGRIADPQAAEVVIPLNDSRTASVTVSAFDGVIQTLAGLTQIPYAIHLKAYYNRHLVFWGPVKVRNADFAAGTVRLDAVDMSLRMVNHHVREGDFASSSDPLVIEVPGGTGATTGGLPISHVGLRMLRDAAETVSFPPLGIVNGTNDFSPTAGSAIGVARGDQVWNTWTQIQQTLGPDFELEPRDEGDGFYAQLNTFDRQGTDVSATVQMHYGTGRQNLEALSFVEGEQYTNLVHVLDRDLTYRETRSNPTTLNRTGPYIAWDATDFDTKHVPETAARAVLDAHGDDILDAYSVPLIALSMTLPVDTPDGFHYLNDYAVGDTIGVAGKTGFLALPEAPYRITRVTLSQDGEGVRQSLEVIADRTNPADLDGSDT